MDSKNDAGAIAPVGLNGRDMVARIAALQDLKEYQELHWSGSFDEYLEVVRKNPRVTRTAFQRVYDMILSFGQEEYIDNKKKIIRYNSSRTSSTAARTRSTGSTSRSCGS